MRRRYLVTDETVVDDPWDEPLTDPHGWDPVDPDPDPAPRRRPREHADGGPSIPHQRSGRTEPRQRPTPGRPARREPATRAPATAVAEAPRTQRSPRTQRVSRPERPPRPERARGPERTPPPERASQPDSLRDLMDLPGPRIRTVAVPVAFGTLVAVALGVWARGHDPAGVAVNLAGFSGALAVKTWLATAAAALGLVQLWSALAMSGRLGRGATPLVRGLHRWSGRAAVLVTVPVAVQCLIAMGMSDATPRALAHSLLGCLFYGAFATKMLLLRRHGVPGWVMAVAGGVLLAVLAGLWLTSAAWFFGTHGITF